jgi:hypothetical protein
VAGVGEESDLERNEEDEKVSNNYMENKVFFDTS